MSYVTVFQMLFLLFEMTHVLHPLSIECTEGGCAGAYESAEFIDGSDIAHQFSNKMSGAVGDKLKELYRQDKFVKIDFLNIVMFTDGMGTGFVRYYLKIPFISVTDSCQAFTSFDHVGGWNHAPAVNERKSQLQKALKRGDSLEMSDLKTTPEGLQEYWIQWRNSDLQAGCGQK